MQGVPYIKNAKLKSAKLIWTLLLLSAIGALIYHMYFLVDQFLLFPKITMVSLGFNELVLPAVTICNVNTFMRSYTGNASRKLQRLVESVDPDQLDPSSNRRRRFVEDFDDFNYTDYIEYDINSDRKNRRNLGPENKKSKIERTFRDLFSREPRHLRRDIGHNIVNMLISCSFKGIECSSKNFTIHQSMDYGNCFTLQSPFMTVDSSGPTGGKYMYMYIGPYCSYDSPFFLHTRGLELILLTENSEYLRGITDGYGARVVVHPQGTFPYPHDQGFFISTATETNVALRLVSIERIGLPHGNCSSGDTFKTSHNLNYTRAVCLSVCEHNLMLERCDCYSGKMEEILIMADQIKDYKLCKSKEEIRCQAEVEEDIRIRSTSCFDNCFSPCSEKQYVKSISQRQWPTEDYTTILIQNVCEKKSKHPAFVDYCRQLLRQDARQRSLQFLKLVVYYEDLNYESIEERPEIEVAQFVSDIGGAFGLWIGLSILSVFELFQLCVEMCDLGCNKCCGHKKDKPVRTKKHNYDSRGDSANNIKLKELNRGIEKDFQKVYPQYGNKKQNYGYDHVDSDYENDVRRRRSEDNLWNIWSRNQKDPAYLY
ncbi:hypothetical protein FSP39_023666 [Pinctada imbricata]|uniref:Uncharacterized protein n=1 Tax=Pinctada imbricata TaxID=66713 RepID=A0AA88Y0Q6_PINIB|nr:hypothetical protein FSP39_023666 [Pinctada imbricata]